MIEDIQKRLTSNRMEIKGLIHSLQKSKTKVQRKEREESKGEEDQVRLAEISSMAKVSSTRRDRMAQRINSTVNITDVVNVMADTGDNVPFNIDSGIEMFNLKKKKTVNSPRKPTMRNSTMSVVSVKSNHSRLSRRSEGLANMYTNKKEKPTFSIVPKKVIEEVEKKEKLPI